MFRLGAPIDNDCKLYAPPLPSPPSPTRPSLLDDAPPVILDPLHGMRAQRQPSLDEADDFTEEDELTTEDFDSDDGVIDDDFSGKCVFMYDIVIMDVIVRTIGLELCY